MKKINAWLLVVKQDFAALANSQTVKEDEAALKADIEAMLPNIFNELEQVLAKILLAAL